MLSVVALITFNTSWFVLDAHSILPSEIEECFLNLKKHLSGMSKLLSISAVSFLDETAASLKTIYFLSRSKLIFVHYFYYRTIIIS